MATAVPVLIYLIDRSCECGAANGTLVTRTIRTKAAEKPQMERWSNDFWRWLDPFRFFLQSDQKSLEPNAATLWFVSITLAVLFVDLIHLMLWDCSFFVGSLDLVKFTWPERFRSRCAFASLGSHTDSLKSSSIDHSISTTCCKLTESLASEPYFIWRDPTEWRAMAYMVVRRVRYSTFRGCLAQRLTQNVSAIDRDTDGLAKGKKKIRVPSKKPREITHRWRIDGTAVVRRRWQSAKSNVQA